MMQTKQGVWSDEIMAKLVEGNLEPDVLLEMQREAKEEDRFDHVLRMEQKRVPWPDRIVLCLQENLYIVEKANKERIVKCLCGHEFGDYRKNYKESALIYERDTDEKLEEVFRGPRKTNPEWQVIREIYCPGCGVMLDVESVAPGYPLVFNFLPDFEAFEKNRKGE
jgi:acetone carboxylase gamma subunit